MLRRWPLARFAAGPAAALLAAVAILGCGAPGGIGGDGSSPGGGASPAPASPGAGGPNGPSGAPPPSSQATAVAPSLPRSGTWVRLEVDGAAPEAREDHTWTVDPEGRVAWLFGGRDGRTLFDQLWVFDLRAESWRLVDVTGDAPAARFGHEAIWMPGRGLVVFGGQAGSTFFDDLWLFTPDSGSASGSWRLLPPGGGAPVPRYGSCSGAGPDGRFWISHGFTSDGARFSDTLAYDFDAEAWSDQAPATDRPLERCLHACWWTSEGQLALYGGQTTGIAALGDLWFLTPGTGGASTNTWSESPGQVAAARHLPAIARHGPATFLFGGRGVDRAAIGETWLAIDGTGQLEPFETAGDEPPARSGAALIEDPAGDRLLLFGGLGGDAFDDLWALAFP